MFYLNPRAGTFREKILVDRNKALSIVGVKDYFVKS